MDEKEEAIRKLAFAFNCTCETIRREVNSVLNEQHQKQMFDTIKRQVRLLDKGKTKSYVLSYTKFDKLRKKRK